MSDGTLSVRRREMKSGDSQLLLDSLSLPSGNHIGQTKLRSNLEIRLHTQTSKRLKEHDKMLKNFKFSPALDSVLKKVSDHYLFCCNPLHSGSEYSTNHHLRSDTRIDTSRWATDSAFRTR